jgi:glycosyltransferase involved in cell wall biosynthesis
MRILAISHACVLGVNRAVYRELAALGNEVSIVTAERWGEASRAIECEARDARDPAVVPLPLTGRSPRVYGFRGLRGVAEAFRPDVVLLDNDPVSRLALQMGYWCRGRASALACISCENQRFDLRSAIRVRGVPKGIATALPKSALASIARRVVDHVFAISDDGLAMHRDLGFGSVSKIPLGFDPQYFHPDAAARARVRSELGWDGPLIAYFGRVVPGKGIHVLVRTMGRMLDRPWRLLLDRLTENGSEYARSIAAQIEALGMGGRVLWCSPAHAAIGAYMNAADVVVVPSLTTPQWKEQYGRVAQEAMACGALVIASRSGTLPELVGDGALTFDEGDEEALAALLAEAIARPAQFDGVRARGLARAQGSLSVRRQAALIAEVFGVLHRRRAAAGAATR